MTVWSDLDSIGQAQSEWIETECSLQNLFLEMFYFSKFSVTWLGTISQHSGKLAAATV